MYGKSQLMVIRAGLSPHRLRWINPQIISSSISYVLHLVLLECDVTVTFFSQGHKRWDSISQHCVTVTFCSQGHRLWHSISKHYEFCAVSWAVSLLINFKSLHQGHIVKVMVTVRPESYFSIYFIYLFFHIPSVQLQNNLSFEANKLLNLKYYYLINMQRKCTGMWWEFAIIKQTA